MSIGNNHSITDHFNQYFETPSLWYHMNPKSIIKKYNLPPQKGLELYGAYVKDQRLLYSTVINRNSIYIEKMADIALFIGWMINLISIIIPVTNINISETIMALLIGVGNLIAIILSTVVKYQSIDDKMQLFKLMEILFHRLYDEIEFHMARVYNGSQDEIIKEQHETCLQIHNKIDEIKTLCPFTISKSILDYHYKQEYIIQLNNVAVNELVTSIIISSTNNQDTHIEITE